MNNNIISEAQIRLVREIKNSFNCDTQKAIKKARKWANIVNYYMKKGG